MVIVLAVSWVSGYALDTNAQGQMVTVRVLIEESFFNDCGDPGSPPDIYWDVYIDGVKHTSVGDPITVNIAPFGANKEFSQDVEVSKQNISINIQEWDDDSGLTGANDKCDIKPGAGRDLTLNLDLAGCQISGDVSGACGESIVVAASSGSPGWFKFKVSIEEPPHAAGLSLRCLHDPIWPQAGQSVTITAEALDFDAAPMPGIVDDVEIWVDNTNAPVKTTASTPGSFGANTSTFAFMPPSNASQVMYRCRVRDGGLWVSSGWRIVQVGPPARGRAVPVVYSGVPDSRIDVVFIADRNDYTGSSDPQFLADVRAVIHGSYYAGNNAIRTGGRPFLFNQDLMNFWIALDTGEAVDYCPSCPHVLPPDWDTKYAFADSGAIVHTTSIRDHASPSKRIFSSEAASLDTFLHETGHSPFGLADEYCCDGGYFEAEPHPNIYSSQSDCSNDSLAAGVINACQKIGTTVNWFRVESTSTLVNDLMVDSGSHTPNAADERQLNWKFWKCLGGEC